MDPSRRALSLQERVTVQSPGVAKESLPTRLVSGDKTTGMCWTY